MRMAKLTGFFCRRVFLSLFLPVFLVSALYVHGSNHACEETVFVHFDKEVYTTGSVVRFKAYLLTRPGERQNSIIYFSIHGRDGREVFHGRIPVVNNMATGLFQLPGQLPEGIYEIRAYTNVMRCTHAEAVFKKSILVLAFAATSGDTLFMPAVVHREVPAPVQKNPGIELKVSGQRMAPGQNMQLGISSNIEDSAFLSLSVCLETPFADVMNNAEIAFSGIACPDSVVEENNSCLQESKGYILAGTLLKRSSRMPLTGADLLLAVTDSTWPALLYAKTDEQGDFYFYLNNHYDNRDLVIQPADSGYRGDLLWMIEDKSLYEVSEMMDIQPNETQQKFLQHIRELRMIEAVFGNGYDTTMGRVLTPGYDAFFMHPDKVTRPAEYVNLHNFNEMDDNILPLIRFFRRDNRYCLSVYNAGQNSWYEDVLLLLNGVPFYDQEYISMLSTKQVKRVDTYTSGLIVGGVSYDGVVSVYTYDNTLPEAYLQSDACVWHNQVLYNGYITVPETVDAGDRIPDFRDNLCFMPDITIGPGETIDIAFKGSLLEGPYRIRINGITASGEPVSLSSCFIIQQDNE